MNVKWCSVTEIAIKLWVMTEADLRSPLTPKMEFFVTSVNGLNSLTTVT